MNKDNMLIIMFILATPLIVYLFLVYIIAVINTSNTVCPKGQTLMLNPWSVGASGKCKP
jgi:hypothetical protein